MVKTIETVQRIHPYNGYQKEPFWKEDGSSTYYNYEIERQCRVPIKSIEEAKKELAIK